MTLVNARAAFETAILNAVKDSDPTVTVYLITHHLQLQVRIKSM